jgi:hypothetical protein
MRVTVTSSHPWDTDTGGILAPGDHADLDDSDRVQDALAAGLLTEVTEPAPAKSPAPSPSDDADASTPDTTSSGSRASSGKGGNR